MINNYVKGKISSISYSFGISTEERNGNALTETVSFVIMDQTIRTMCGDAFFATAGNAFPLGKLKLKCF